MLGHARYEISLKRRQFIKSVIKDEYRYLCSNSQEITDYLFGDNLEERIKEINLTNRLANSKPQYRKSDWMLQTLSSKKPIQSSFFRERQREPATDTILETLQRSERPEVLNQTTGKFERTHVRS